MKTSRTIIQTGPHGVGITRQEGEARQLTDGTWMLSPLGDLKIVTVEDLAEAIPDDYALTLAALGETQSKLADAITARDEAIAELERVTRERTATMVTNDLMSAEWGKAQARIMELEARLVDA